MYSTARLEAAERAKVEIRRSMRPHLFAEVDNTGTHDFAISLGSKRAGLIRYVDQAKPEDHTALATMMAEGDFVWAGLVYGAREGSAAVGLVESFHLSELEQLAARLSALREAFDETR